jgi:hypothetical protein
MAFRKLTMIDIKEVLRRWSAGQSDRKIGREAGADRKTVARYTTAATRLGFVRGGEFARELRHPLALRPSVAGLARQPSTVRVDDPPPGQEATGLRISRHVSARFATT